MKRILFVMLTILLVVIFATHIPTSNVNAVENLTVRVLPLKAKMYIVPEYSTAQTWLKAGGWFPKECNTQGNGFISLTVTDISSHEHQITLVSTFSGDRTLDFCVEYVNFSVKRPVGNYPAGTHMFWVNKLGIEITINRNQR